MEADVSRVPEAFRHLARARNNDGQAFIDDLCSHYGDELTAHLLGVKTFAVRFHRQPASVVRLAFALHRMTFRPGDPLRVFDLLTVGKYEQTPQEPPRPARQRAA